MKWHATKRDKTRGHEEHSILSSIYTYSYSNPLWMTLYQTKLNAKHDNGTRFRQHEH